MILWLCIQSTCGNWYWCVVCHSHHRLSFALSKCMKTKHSWVTDSTTHDTHIQTYVYPTVASAVYRTLCVAKPKHSHTHRHCLVTIIITQQQLRPTQHTQCKHTKKYIFSWMWASWQCTHRIQKQLWLWTTCVRMEVDFVVFRVPIHSSRPQMRSPSEIADNICIVACVWRLPNLIERIACVRVHPISSH